MKFIRTHADLQSDEANNAGQGGDSVLLFFYNLQTVYTNEESFRFSRGTAEPLLDQDFTSAHS